MIRDRALSFSTEKEDVEKVLGAVPCKIFPVNL